MSDLAAIQKAIQDQFEAFNEFKRLNDARLAALAEGKAVGDLTAKVETINTALDKIEEKRAALEAEVLKLKRPGANAEDQKRESDLKLEVKHFNMQARERNRDHKDIGVEDYAVYKGAFLNFMRKGNLDAMPDVDRKAMSIGSDPDGGYLAPPSTQSRTIQRIFELSPVRQLAYVESITTGDIEGLVDIDDVDDGWVSETQQRDETNTPQLRKYKIVAEEQYAQPKATQKLLDDAVVDVEGWLANKVGSRFARREGYAFCIGDGVGKPMGFCSYGTSASDDATRAWGTLQHVVTGANGAFHTTKADPLQDLITAFKPAYLANAKWLGRREVIGLIRKLKEASTDRYLWEPSMQAGAPSKLLGYDYIVMPDMPAVATGSLSLALADMRSGYTIVDRQGIRVLRDPFTSKPYVKFYTTRRVGGGVVDFEAIKFLKFST